VVEEIQAILIIEIKGQISSEKICDIICENLWTKEIFVNLPKQEKCRASGINLFVHLRDRI